MSAVILMRYYDFLCQIKNGNGKMKLNKILFFYFRIN